jgi:hypothetical protein
MMNLEKQSRCRVEWFLKTLFALSRCRIAEDDGFTDMLFRSQMHVDDREIHMRARIAWPNVTRRG